MEGYFKVANSMSFGVGVYGYMLLFGSVVSFLLHKKTVYRFPVAMTVGFSDSQQQSVSNGVSVAVNQ